MIKHVLFSTTKEKEGRKREKVKKVRPGGFLPGNNSSSIVGTAGVPASQAAPPTKKQNIC
jgi:hypothetical protein